MVSRGHPGEQKWEVTLLGRGIETFLPNSAFTHFRNYCFRYLKNLREKATFSKLIHTHSLFSPKIKKKKKIPPLDIPTPDELV